MKSYTATQFASRVRANIGKRDGRGYRVLRKVRGSAERLEAWARRRGHG